VIHQEIHDLGVRAGDPAVELAVELPDEVIEQGRDVLLALPQGRDVDRHDVEPVEEILPEAALPDVLLEVAVGGGHEPDVHLDRLDAADALELVVLDHPQELHLHLPGQIADLVEEERPLVRELEAPGLAGDGPREGALLVAEQLALDEVLGDRRAVDLDEGVVLSGAAGVDRVGHEFLPRPRLAGDEDRRRRGGHLPDDLEDPRHVRARPHDLAAVDLRRGQLDLLVAQHPRLHRLADHALELLLVEGLRDVVEGSLLEGVHGRGDGPVGGDEDDGDGGVLLGHAAQQAHAVELRHLEVGHAGRHVVALEQGEGLEAVGRRLDLVALLGQHRLEHEAHVDLVVDDEDLFLGDFGHLRSHGRVIEKQTVVYFAPVVKTD